MWVLPLVIVLLVVTFPLWNPQTLYIRWLIRGLGNESTHEKDFKVLTQDFGERAVEPLIEALNDKDPQIQTRARDALVAIGTPAIAPLLAQVFYPGPQEVLVQMGAPAVMPLFAKIEEINNTVLWYSLIGRIGMPAVEPLIAAGRNGSARNRSDAMNILFCENCLGIESGILVREPPTGDTFTHAVEFLTALVGDADPSIRRQAVAALPRLPWMADQLAPLLITALKDEDLSVRMEAAVSLWLVHDERAVPALVAAMNDEDPGFRAKAAVALVGTEAGINALVAMFNAEELANTYRDSEVIIRGGDVASVPILIAVLFSQNDSYLPEIFLNCGNSDLYHAASQWGWNRDYFVLPSYSDDFQGSAGPTWGGH